jgi:sulfide:quinone oxidoreductase
VSPKTLQSEAYKNVFALGDCSNSPNAKTAAAVSSQFKAVKTNLLNVMNGKECTKTYDGYGSCPLITDSKHVMLAEFNYEGPIETMPFNQAKPLYLSFLMKRYLMAPLFWHMLLKGRWNGPENIRKIMHLGFGK